MTQASGPTGLAPLDVHALLDVLVTGTVMVLVMWELEIAPSVSHTAPSLVVGTVWAAYAVADAMVLALAAHACIRRDTRRRFGSSFAAGIGLWLAADFAFVGLGVRARDGRVVEALAEYSPQMSELFEHDCLLEP